MSQNVTFDNEFSTCALYDIDISDIYENRNAGVTDVMDQDTRLQDWKEIRFGALFRTQ
jgi:hypothetical protein